MVRTLLDLLLARCVRVVWCAVDRVDGAAKRQEVEVGLEQGVDVTCVADVLQAGATRVRLN